MRETIPTPAGDAWADIDQPRGTSRALLLIGHGAGGSVDSRDLLAVRDGCLAAAIAIARVTQPYRVAGRKAPVVAPRLDEAWIAATAHVRSLPGLARLPAIHAGRSSGARVACRTAAATGAAAVIALAFPLHPPGQPDKSRLAELELPTVPVLVVQGDRDPFGLPPTAPRRSVVLIPGADHSLKKDPRAVAVAVVEFVTSMIEDAKVR